MGIARRKAGTVVLCPKCQGQVVVPIPPPENGRDQPPTPEDKDNLFEKDDFGKFLHPGGGAPPYPAAPPMQTAPAAPAAMHPPMHAPMHAPAAAASQVDWPDTLLPPDRTQRGLFLTPGLLTLLGVLVLLLLGLAFFVGLLLGKASVAA
ncbi:MAG: hypothetical protein U0793_09730 [Gemmataceae bacterium]